MPDLPSMVPKGTVVAPAVKRDKGRREVPVAPLAAVIVNANKIFLSDGGGSNLAYDAFYSEMKD